MMEHTSTHEPAREARLAQLREDLDERLDELATAGGAGLATVKDRFDQAWKELNELLGTETRH